MNIYLFLMPKFDSWGKWRVMVSRRQNEMHPNFSRAFAN